MVLTRGAVTFRVLLRCAELDDRILEDLLVVGPGSPLRVEQPLKFAVLGIELCQFLLYRSEFLLDSLVFALQSGFINDDASADKRNLTHLMSRDLGLSRTLVLLVRNIKTVQGCLVSFADLAELLDVAPRRSKIDFSHLESGPTHS